MIELRAIARLVVFAAFCLAVLVAFADWLVRSRRLSPFSSVSRGLRSLSSPFTLPIERRLVRAGANPVHAGWWLVIGTAVLGVVSLSAIDLLARVLYTLSGAAQGGPRALLRVAVDAVYYVLLVALFVRVIGSWFGAFRYARWMRPAYWLTDWLVEPIGRVLPPAGAFDFSPLVAWLALWILRWILLAVILSIF